jgi:hypothetical protein
MKVAICFSRPSDPGINIVVNVSRLSANMRKLLLGKMQASKKDAPVWRKELMDEGYYEIGLPASFYNDEALFKARVKLPCLVDAFVTAYTEK